jgi:hypothetical protein
MAIIWGGRFVRDGSHAELVEQLTVRIWSKTFDKADLEAHRERYDSISTRLFAGRTEIHVFSEADPGDGFSPVRGGLEDVYFSTLSGVRRAA